MSRIVHPRAVAAAAAAALLLGLSACGGSDDPKTGPTATPSASSGSPTASPTEEASASPSVTPATGPLLKIEGAQMSAPAGWKKMRNVVRFDTEANPPTGMGAARISALAFPGTAPSLDEEARIAHKGDPQGIKRMPDVEIGGEPFFHFAGKRSKYVFYDKYGAVTHGYQVGISFDLPLSMPAADRQKIIDESLASFAWQ